MGIMLLSILDRDWFMHTGIFISYTSAQPAQALYIGETYQALVFF